jgi:hypothetical protein
LSWQTVAAFIRIATNPRIPGQRFTLDEAAGVVDQWVEQPNVLLLAPGDQHWNILRKLLIARQARGPLTSDAHNWQRWQSNMAVSCIRRIEALADLPDLRGPIRSKLALVARKTQISC